MKKRRFFLKITSLLLIIGLNCSGILGVEETMAYFNDREISENNIYTMGILDFSLFSPHDNFVPEIKIENMEPGQKVNRMIQVQQEGNLPFKYTIRTEKIAGDDDFCNALELEAKLEGEIKYPNGGDNSLMNFSLSAMEMKDPPGIDTWQFEILLPDDVPDSLQNKICEFKFVFESWQDDVENYEEKGFDDAEEIESNLTSSVWSENWIKVDYPNGGEIWYVGRYYNILWTTGDFNNCNGQLKIDLWYSADSGTSWANIVKNTKDDGSYNWRVPLFLYNEMGDIYFMASAKARIKAVATCSSDSTITTWDMSDEDFCPPIDYDLLTAEEIEILESLGLFNNSDIVEGGSISDDISGTGEEFDFEDEGDKNNKEDGEILEDLNKKETENLELEISEEEKINEIEDEETNNEEIEEINNLDDDSEENEDDTNDSDDVEDTTGEDEDAKDEEFVLAPKEEILPDEDDLNGNDGDGNNDGNNGENNENGLNKNSVDCVQAVK